MSSSTDSSSLASGFALLFPRVYRRLNKWVEMGKKAKQAKIDVVKMISTRVTDSSSEGIFRETQRAIEEGRAEFTRRKKDTDGRLKNLTFQQVLPRLKRGVEETRDAEVVIDRLRDSFHEIHDLHENIKILLYTYDDIRRINRAKNNIFRLALNVSQTEQLPFDIAHIKGLFQHFIKKTDIATDRNYKIILDLHTKIKKLEVQRADALSQANVKRDDERGVLRRRYAPIQQLSQKLDEVVIEKVLAECLNVQKDPDESEDELMENELPIGLLIRVLQIIEREERRASHSMFSSIAVDKHSKREQEITQHLILNEMYNRKYRLRKHVLKKLKTLIQERFKKIDAVLNGNASEVRLSGEARSDVTAIVNVENAVILELANDLVELIQRHIRPLFPENYLEKDLVPASQRSFQRHRGVGVAGGGGAATGTASIPANDPASTENRHSILVFFVREYHNQIIKHCQNIIRDRLHKMQVPECLMLIEFSEKYEGLFIPDDDLTYFSPPLTESEKQSVRQIFFAAPLLDPGYVDGPLPVLQPAIDRAIEAEEAKIKSSLDNLKDAERKSLRPDSPGLDVEREHQFSQKGYVLHGNTKTLIELLKALLEMHSEATPSASLLIGTCRACSKVMGLYLINQMHLIKGIRSFYNRYDKKKSTGFFAAIANVFSSDDDGLDKDAVEVQKRHFIFFCASINNAELAEGYIDEVRTTALECLEAVCPADSPSYERHMESIYTSFGAALCNFALCQKKASRRLARMVLFDAREHVHNLFSAKRLPIKKNDDATEDNKKTLDKNKKPPVKGVEESGSESSSSSSSSSESEEPEKPFEHPLQGIIDMVDQYMNTGLSGKVNDGLFEMIHPQCVAVVIKDIISRIVVIYIYYLLYDDSDNKLVFTVENIQEWKKIIKDDKSRLKDYFSSLSRDVEGSVIITSFLSVAFKPIDTIMDIFGVLMEKEHGDEELKFKKVEKYEEKFLKLFDYRGDEKLFKFSAEGEEHYIVMAEMLSEMAGKILDKVSAFVDGARWPFKTGTCGAIMDKSDDVVRETGERRIRTDFPLWAEVARIVYREKFSVEAEKSMASSEEADLAKQNEAFKEVEEHEDLAAKDLDDILDLGDDELEDMFGDI